MTTLFFENLYSMKTVISNVCLCLFLFAMTGSAVGEGTKEIMPDNTNGTGLIVSTSTGFPLGSVGNYHLCPVDNRISFNIKDYTKENLYYGFHWVNLTGSGTTSPYSDVWIRIYTPSGAVAATVKLPVAGAGFISTYASAVNGPNIGGANTSGYSPLVFTPTQNGNYYAEIYRSTNGGASEITGGESMLSTLFDMTVAQADNTRFTGRVHCNKWAFSVYDPATGVQSSTLSSEARYYAYTADSVVTKVNFESGFRPLAFIVAVNSYGVVNNNYWPTDRKSVNATALPALTGGYNVFLNLPDSILYPPCTIPLPPSLVSPVISGCPPGPYNIRFSAPQAGDFYLLLDLNGTPGYQANSADRFIELINQSPGIISYSWDGKNGQGVSVPANTSFPITFYFRKGRINLPLYDVELNINGLNVSGVSPISSSYSRIYWDDTQLSTIGDGTCSSTTNNYNNTGAGYANDIVGQLSPAHAWNGDGNAAFSVPAPAVGGNDADNLQCNDFGNARLINSWAWGIELSTTQTLTLTCINISGTVWDDADNSAAGSFTNIKTGAETGANAGGLYAILVDPLTGNVLASAAVNADGTWSIAGCPANATGMEVVISATAGVIGNPAPAGAIPASWIATSPLARSFNTLTTDIAGIDFGIEKGPDSDSEYYSIPAPVLNSYMVLNGSGAYNSPGPLSGSDYEDGIMGTGKKLVITQVPANAGLYYNGVLLTNNTTIPAYDPTLLKVRYTQVNIVSLIFQYAFVDAAGKQDPTPATYTINWVVILTANITSFTGRPAGNAVILDWTAVNQEAGVSYVIERSPDGNGFKDIGSTAFNEYADSDPLQGQAWYRLKLVNAAGGITYSNTITVNARDGADPVGLSPNPFVSEINLSVNCENAGKIVLRLSDDKGMLIRQVEMTGGRGINHCSMKGLSILPASVYFVQVLLPDRCFVKKAIKK